MTARLIPLADLRDRDLGAWRELAGRAVEPNPFFDPDFVLPAAGGLGFLGLIAVIAIVAGGEWLACLPVRRFHRWHRLPLPCVATWRHSYCLLGTPLLAPEADAGGTLVELMRAQRGVSFAALDWVPATGPVAAALDRAAVPSIPFEELTRATIVRRPENDYLDGRLKGKHKREFRRLSKGLEDELGGELELVGRSSDPKAIEAFLDLEAAGWKGRSGTALATDPGHARFFREMATRMSKRGALELDFLEGGGAIAAARCSLVAGDASFCFKVAFNEELKRFSPGRELELRLIDRFHEQGRLEWMDSCADAGNELFNRLWPDRRTLRTVAYRARGPLGVTARPALRAVTALRDQRQRQAVQ